MRTTVWAILGMLVTAVAAQDAWEARRQRLGTPQDPYRILVDKVLMASNNWVMTPDHVAEMKAADSRQQATKMPHSCHSSILSQK